MLKFCTKFKILEELVCKIHKRNTKDLNIENLHHLLL